jgi:hypothetical protein
MNFSALIANDSAASLVANMFWQFGLCRRKLGRVFVKPLKITCASATDVRDPLSCATCGHARAAHG